MLIEENTFVVSLTLKRRFLYRFTIAFTSFFTLKMLLPLFRGWWFFLIYYSCRVIYSTEVDCNILNKLNFNFVISITFLKTIILNNITSMHFDEILCNLRRTSQPSSRLTHIINFINKNWIFKIRISYFYQNWDNPSTKIGFTIKENVFFVNQMIYKKSNKKKSFKI